VHALSSELVEAPPVDLEGRHHWRNLLLGAEHRRGDRRHLLGRQRRNGLLVDYHTLRVQRVRRHAQTNRADVALHLTLGEAQEPR
jgi:hypothetical protein